MFPHNWPWKVVWRKKKNFSIQQSKKHHLANYFPLSHHPHRCCSHTASSFDIPLFLTPLRLVVICRFNFLQHEISILNRKISNQNTTHCGAFLPWFLKSTLVLAQLALKMHAFSACINGVSQLSFRASQAVYRNLWYTKISSMEGNLFTFGLICYFCPGSQKKNILIARCKQICNAQGVYWFLFSYSVFQINVARWLFLSHIWLFCIKRQILRQQGQ